MCDRWRASAFGEGRRRPSGDWFALALSYGRSGPVIREQLKLDVSELNSGMSIKFHLLQAPLTPTFDFKFACYSMILGCSVRAWSQRIHSQRRDQSEIFAGPGGKA